MAFSKYVTTSSGRDMMLSCLISGDFQIQSLVLGSGRYTGLLTEIKSIVTPEMTFAADDMSILKKDGQIEIIARLTNELIQDGFNWREYGVYVTDGTNTVLYCYDNAGEDPIPITSIGSGSAISSTIKIILTVEDAAVVNVTFEPAPEITVDEEVTEDSENPVSSAAIYAFVDSHAAPASHSHAGYAQIKLFSNSTVATGAWNADTTYADFPFAANVACNGISESDVPEVVFSAADAVSGVFAPVAKSGNGTVTIYAAEQPTAAITIPTIICIKAVT